MKTYDYIIVGSGITGLTASRILSQHGKRVLLLEKAPILGGSLARFRLGGIPFDVGFHFTGGFNDERNGVLDVMLKLLGVNEQIHPIYFPRDASHRMIFPTLSTQYVLPCGVDIIREKMKKDFPHLKDGLDRYFNRFNAVVEATPTLHVNGFDEFPPPIDEDSITLQSVFDEWIPDPMVQTILGGLCMCYGTRPDQVSFSTHCRVSYGLQESLARVEDGGDAFVDALVDALVRDRIDIKTKTTIQQIADVKDRKAGHFVLSDGTQVAASACIFTIHPQSILAILPKEHVSKAFGNRVRDFEASNSFFTLYGSLDKPPAPETPGIPETSKMGGPATLVSVLPDVDLNAMLTSRHAYPVDGPMMVLRSMEKATFGPVQTVTALEVAFPESTHQWFGTKLKRRPTEYYEYKDERTASIVARMNKHLPECRGMKLIDSASSLTYRDYLHSPDGSAYGVRQKMGQFNVAGRLPISNLHAAGQSALLPGVLGAMTSAFFVCRGLLGRDVFRNYLAGEPCNSTVS